CDIQLREDLVDSVLRCKEVSRERQLTVASGNPYEVAQGGRRSLRTFDSVVHSTQSIESSAELFGERAKKSCRIAVLQYRLAQPLGVVGSNLGKVQSVE